MDNLESKRQDIKQQMVLDSEQLNQIKEFIRRRGFRETDLQYEILDHMACKVEEKLNARPDLDFDEAVVQAHRDFGIFGFSTVEDAMRRSLEKQYWKQVAAEFRLWFRFPSFLLVGGFGLLLYQAYRVWPVFWLVLAVLVIYLLSHIFLFVSFRKEVKKYRYTINFQSANLYTVVIPTIFFQIFGRLMDITELSSAVFAFMVLISAFGFGATRRVLAHAVSRCAYFEKQYGPLAE